MTFKKKKKNQIILTNEPKQARNAAVFLQSSWDMNEEMNQNFK